MDALTKKKLIEKRQLERFISNPEFKSKVTAIHEGETPDFIIEIDDKKISVELTQLIKPNLKQYEEFRKSIIDEAASQFINKYEAKLNCYFTFLNIELDGGPVMFKKFSQELFRTVEKIYLENTSTEINVELKNENLKSDFLKRVHVSSILGYYCWQHISAHKVDQADVDKIKLIIENKENNISKYRESFEENWLLIVSNIGNKSSSNHYDFLDFRGIETKFERVFAFKDMDNEIIVIK